MESNNPDFIWQDRDIRFDSKSHFLSCRRGESIIDSINSVEDTKGNNGERGSLVVTNLRIIWVCHVNSRINLSIGLNTILNINIRKAKSKLKGHTQALCVLAKSTTRYEFVFTSLVKNSPRMFTTVQAVMKAYETSKLYRDLKLRGSVVREGELMQLPQEKIFSTITGVWNLSADQGNLGIFFLTNVRLVWHANLAANFNVSLPYMQIKAIRFRDSRFGQALVLETYSKAGGYILGFKVDPAEKMEEVYKELTSLHQIYSKSPIFGIEFMIEDEMPSVQQLLQPRIEEDVEILDEQEDIHAVAAYYAAGVDDDEGHAQNIRYDSKLGLAIEAMQDGMTLDQLWRVI